MTNPPRVGLIVPASNSVMEPDFHRALGGVVTISTWRIVLESVTREAEIMMLEEELPRCLEGLGPTHPDLAVFGCTSAGSLEGLKHDASVAQFIERVSGAATVTVMGAVVEQLQIIDPGRVAVLTPYQQELTDSVAGCVSEAGFEVTGSGGMGIVDNLDIGRVTPAEIVRFAVNQMEGLEADCAFLSCTNWQAVAAIHPLEKMLGIPVICSNQAAIEAVVRLLKSRLSADRVQAEKSRS